MASVLVIDDDPSLRTTVERVLRREGCGVLSASSGREGLDYLAREPVDVVLTDLKMEELSGLDVLRAVREAAPLTQVVLITAHATIEDAVAAMKQGAYDFLVKPVERAELVSTVLRAAERRRLEVENRALRARVDEEEAAPPVIGSSPRMSEIRKTVHKVAASAATVLIEGETGTGKEVIARSIHAHSPRRGGPFVVVNCAALPDTLMEAELFGHEKGAFTGADSRRKGRFELADGGSILLDEVGEMQPSAQAKLLRVLESGEFERLGGAQTLHTDVRAIAASNRDLAAAVADGSFREDLYYRLRVIHLRVPPLRERRQDVPLLAQHFLQLYARRNGRSGLRLAPDALDILQRYSWPGNVRELQNALEAAVVLAHSETMTAEDLPANITASVHTLRHGEQGGIFVPLGTSMAEVERQVLHHTLDHFGGDKEAAARALGISSRTIYRKLADGPSGDAASGAP
ncbi:MAG: sigma-54-dependent transcriptional regulator [bacterium]